MTVHERVSDREENQRYKKVLEEGREGGQRRGTEKKKEKEEIRVRVWVSGWQYEIGGADSGGRDSRRDTRLRASK